MNKALVLAVACLLALPVQAMASITALDPQVEPGSATTAAHAIAANPAEVTGADSPEHAYDGGVAPSPIGVGDKTQGPEPKGLAGFPTDGDTYAILSTGQISDIGSLLINDSGTTSFAFTDQFTSPFSPGRGTRAHDWTVLKIDVDVPAGANCLTLDYRFLSEEFTEFVGSEYNDAFIAEVDATSWQVGEGGNITRPNDFAVAQGGAPVSVNGVGPTAVSAAEAAGTYFDAATGLLKTKTPITPGAHSIYLSLFDASDQIFDSAIFLDNLRFISEASSTCRPPEQPLLGQLPATTPPPASTLGLPSNAFSVGRHVKLTKGGTAATLTVYVPGPGNLTAGTRKKRTKKPLLLTAKARANAAGPVRITVRLSSTGKKLLARKRKLVVPVTVTYTPDGGITGRKTVKVKFKKRGAKKKHRSRR